jgi:hypothetical protein
MTEASSELPIVAIPQQAVEEPPNFPVRCKIRPSGQPVVAPSQVRITTYGKYFLTWCGVDDIYVMIASERS